MDTEPLAKDMAVTCRYGPERLPGRVLNANCILCTASRALYVCSKSGLSGRVISYSFQESVA